MTLNLVKFRIKFLNYILKEMRRNGRAKISNTKKHMAYKTKEPILMVY